MSLKRAFLVLACGVLMTATNAFAGVRGNSYDTAFDTTGNTFNATLAFDGQGNGMVFTQDEEDTGGVYFEYDLVFFSVFVFNLDSDARFTGVGLSILSHSVQGVVLLDEGQIDFAGTESTD